MQITDYIGKIVLSKFPFYDIINRRHSIKSRPVLIIGVAEENTISPDFNILPISTISDKKRISRIYDFKIILKNECYVRIHKQGIVNKRDIEYIIKDFKKDGMEEWQEIIKLHQAFQSELYN